MQHRCLNESGGKFLIVPITINYEKIPEQSGLSVEAEGNNLGFKMSIFGLFSWLKVRSNVLIILQLHEY